MPEIKNSFQKGIMNKDLDERLIPNGEFKDAMNVQISTSEESGVGTVQNILGNIRVEDIVNIPDAKCVGAIADEKNDVLYWFITSSTVDAIIEYSDDPFNQSTNTCTPILVDTHKNVLKFSPSNLITGINIIDNLLFWTDNVNEPKKINIDTLKLNSNPNLSTHSGMFVNGVSVGNITEDHITVIRKRPTKAPDVKFIEVESHPLTDMPNLNFNGLGIGSVITNYQLGDQNNPVPIPPFSPNDFILLSESTASGVLPQNYQVKLLVTSYSPVLGTINSAPANVGVIYNFEVVEILNSFPNEDIDFNATKTVDVENLFEKDFVRFATRYKYADGEYSAFSPFTQPVFVTGRFGFHPTKDPYNLGMENQLLNVRLDNLLETKTPEDVIQLDILFKKERSTTIYSVDSIKINDPSPNAWDATNFTGGAVYSWNGTGFVSEVLPGEYPTGQYDITVENIYAALPENQILRPWDNVPRKALAQEITGNRVIYGNYLQNYTNTDINGDLASPDIIVEKEERSFNINGTVSSFDNFGLKSIKSLRTYYLGVLYGDKYGRETPVFTNKEASINIPYQELVGGQVAYNPAKSLRLKARLSGNVPSWAHYYKFYIKETTGEYYNLTLDRVYKNQSDFNLWLSFPSSDRNKVQEGDYIILKKQVDIESVVPVEEKIKIIDIKNEAPESIKYNFISLGSGGGTATDNSALFPDLNQQPGEGVGKLLIDREAWIETEGGIDLVDGTTSSDRLAVQFSTTTGGNIIKSKRYFISAWSLEDVGTDGGYSLLLREIIDAEDSWVESSPGILNADDGFTITIFKLELKDVTEFEGRFFMKVISNAVTQTYLIPSVSDTDIWRVLGKMQTFALADTASTMGSFSDGIYNTQKTSWTSTSSNAITDTPDKWSAATQFDTGTDDQGAFFIDSMYFVAAQEDTGTNIDAGKSGRMVKGNDLTGTDPELEYINGLEGILEIDTTPGEPYGLNATSGAPQGIRHWSSTYIRMEDNMNILQYKTGMANYDNTYNPLQDGYMMHLSFVCPGEDLHDGTHLNTVSGNSDWSNSAGTGFMATWASNVAASKFPYLHIDSQKIYATFGYIAPNAFGMQGFNNADWEKKAGFDTDVNGNWSNISAADQEISQNQFNPGWKNPYAKSIVDNLVVGNKFKIDGDDHTIYTILKINKKYLYNHTAWNLSPTWLSNGQTLRVYDHPVIGTSTADWAYPSVCEAYAKLMTNLYNAAGSNYFAAFKNTLENFGKANNRRVCYIMELDKDPSQQPGYAASLGTASKINPIQIRFVDTYIEEGQNTLPTSPAIFETEAKEDQDLNIYYEASDCLPLRVEDDAGDTRGHLLAPIGSKILCSLNGSDPTDWDTVNEAASQEVFLRVTGWSGNTLSISLPGLVYDSAGGSGLEATDYIGKWLRFVREDGSYTQAVIKNITIPSNNKILELEIKENTSGIYSGLPYYNCFSFGNGVESNRIRDDFNESFILNGVKASTVLEEPYEEERRKYGLIYSGLYNSISGINNLNQFIQAEKITKDLMPIYGSIQRLYARDKDLITLCEDKVLQIFVDRDVLFNADGNAQLLSTDRVLGEANPFRGNYGISKNPESFAVESFRAYFTDKQRGAVLRLSMDGLTPISDAGMHDFFRDNLRDGGRLYGSYDSHKGDYNLTINFADGENKVCNPGFEEGLTTDVALGSNFVLNNSFSSVSGSAASTVTQFSRNWVTGGGQQFYTTYIDLDDSTGVEVGMSITEIQGSNAGGILANMTIYTIVIPMNTITITSINTGGGSGGSDRLNLSGTLVGINGTGTLGAVSSFNVTFEKANTIVTDNWTLNNNVINNGFGDLVFSDGGEAVQTGSNLIESGKTYRITQAPWNSSGHPLFSLNGVTIISSSQDITFSASSNDITLSVINGGLNLPSITIQEATPFGGNVDCWDLNGADSDFLYTSQSSSGGSIIFDEAPEDTYLYQNLIYTNGVLDFTDGTKCNVTFDITNYTGSGELTFVLYNDDGDGFEYAISGNGSYSFSDVIGNVTGGTPTGKFGFIVSSTSDFSGEIDNVSLVIDGEGAGKTISYNERSKGWTCFKSFIPEFGISSVNQYYTMNLGQLWKHHTNQTRNTFYNNFTESSITPILNMQPEIVKHFNTLNYEGSQSKVDQFLSTPIPGLVPSENLFFNSDLSQGDDFNGAQLSSFTNSAMSTTLPVTLLDAASNVILFNDPATFNVNNDQIEVNNLSVAGSFSSNGQFTFGGTLDVIEIIFNGIHINNTLHNALTGGQVFTVGEEYVLTFDYSCGPVDYPNAVGYNATAAFPMFNYSIYVDSTVHDTGTLDNSGTYTTTFTPTTGGAGGTPVKLTLGNSYLNSNNFFPVNVSIDNVSIQVMVSDTINDGEYYNLQTKKGWYVSNIYTDKQEGTLNEFIEKEGKWFNYIKGTSDKIDTAAFNFQGLGVVDTVWT